MWPGLLTDSNHTRPPPGPCQGAYDALLLVGIPHVLPRRLLRVLAAPLAPPPRLPAPGRQLLLLRQLEPLPRPGHLRLGDVRLPPRPRHQRTPLAARAAGARRRQRHGQPRAALLLQVR